MMPQYRMGPVRDQAPTSLPAYDRWTNPDGETVAEFYRAQDHFLVRFVDRVDFAIAFADMSVSCFPASSGLEDVADALFHNAIVPLIGNYQGQLHLHGSAVAIDGRSYAFMGQSRRGKTTLAGSFALAGYPYLTEDVVALAPVADGPPHICPTRPILRLFADSAAHLLGEAGDSVEADEKRAFDAAGRLPFAACSYPLGGIFLLGPGRAETVSVARMDDTQALAELMQHAFILDVEDKHRLRRHFASLAELVSHTPCYALDFPRSYYQLPRVVEQVVATARMKGRDQ